MAKFHVKKDDTVKVISGESKGEEGKVLEVYPSKNRALVEGVNIVKRHTKPNATHPNGGIVEQEASIHLSNLMLVDPKTGDATRIGRKVVDGKIERYSKKSGEVIK
ncbi:MAG: 50S ribosomal protein L24 [Flavobacteriales bacterium]